MDIFLNKRKKQEILDQCQYGFNVMKDSVMVGLTMKSMDYMCGGITYDQYDQR